MATFITATVLSVTILTSGGVSQRSVSYENMPTCKSAMMEEVQMYDRRETVRHIGNGVVFVADPAQGYKIEVRMNCTSQRQQPGQPKPGSADVPQ